MTRPVRIRKVEPTGEFCVRLEFTDDTIKEIDLEPFLRGPVFEPLRRDPEQFRRVRVDERMGTIIWDNGADIDPDVLYHDLKPAWMEEEGEVGQRRIAL